MQSTQSRSDVVVPLHNWEGRIQWKADFVHAPRDRQELIALVLHAHVARQRVKVVGAGHSWSDIASSNYAGNVPCHLVSLDNISRVLAFDLRQKTITVEGGRRIKDINRYLWDIGLALSNQGSVNQQSIAGAISTGTHGTGVNYGPIHSKVLNFELLSAQGEIYFCSREENPELYFAALVGLGALGIIISVTLQCEEKFHLRIEETKLSYKEFEERHASYLSNNQHVKSWHLPHTDTVIVSSYNRTREGKMGHGPFMNWLHEVVIKQYLSEGLLYATVLAPSLTKTMMNLMANTLQTRTRVDRCYQLFSWPVIVCHSEMEWGIPIEAELPVLRELHNLMRDKHNNVNFIIEVRQVAKDDAWLSMAYNRNTCFIGVMMYGRSDEETHNWFKSASEIMQRYQGRPHWGKTHFCTPEYLASVYPKMVAWQQIRQQLDPHAMFINDSLARHL